MKEGTLCFDGNGPEEPLDECPDSTPEEVRGGEPLIDPIIQYPNTDQPRAVICGYVYRGLTFDSMDGVFVFGDLSTRGQLFAAIRPSGDELWPTHTIDIVDEDASQLQQLISFGRDSDGGLYVVGIGGEGGGFYRLVPAA